MKIKREWFQQAAEYIDSGETHYTCCALEEAIVKDPSDIPTESMVDVIDIYANLMEPETSDRAFWLDNATFTNAFEKRGVRVMLLLFAGEALHGGDHKKLWAPRR
jgi:hypothetical protein